jgi:hypothetical protein
LLVLSRKGEWSGFKLEEITFYKEGKGRFDGIQAHDMSRLIDHRLSQKRGVLK